MHGQGFYIQSETYQQLSNTSRRDFRPTKFDVFRIENAGKTRSLKYVDLSMHQHACRLDRSTDQIR